MRLPITRQHLPIIATIVSFVAMYLGASLMYYDRNFVSLGVFLNLFTDNAVLGIVAVGMTYVILSGGIDLSVGAMIGLISISTAALVQHHNFPPFVAWGLMLLVGVVIGAVQGSFVAFFDLPPFLVTLAGMFFCRGLALVISEESIGIKNRFILDLGYKAINIGSGRLTVLACALLVVFVVAILLSIFSRFGRNVYAIGGSEVSARLMGLPVQRTKIGVYVFSGFCAALAGVCQTIYQASGNANDAMGMELDAIAAVVVGGTLLTGGVGYVGGTLLGVLILGLIQTMINFNGQLSSWWTKVFIGALLLLFVGLQKIIQTASGDKKH